MPLIKHDPVGLPRVGVSGGWYKHATGVRHFRTQGVIIDYTAARRREEPISTAVTESTVQWLLHRRMNTQQMRSTPRGAHLVLGVRCAGAVGSPATPVATV